MVIFVALLGLVQQHLLPNLLSPNQAPVTGYFLRQKEFWLALIAKSDFCERPETQVSRFARRSERQLVNLQQLSLWKKPVHQPVPGLQLPSSCSICLKSPKIPFAGSSPDLFSVRVTIISSSSDGV